MQLYFYFLIARLPLLTFQEVLYKDAVLKCDKLKNSIHVRFDLKTQEIPFKIAY